MLNKLSLTLFAAAVCFAQPHGMGRHGTPSFTGIKAYLNLSDTQVTSITAANSAARESNRAVHEQLRAKHDALQTALKAGSADAAAPPPPCRHKTGANSGRTPRSPGQAWDAFDLEAVRSAGEYSRAPAAQTP